MPIYAGTDAGGYLPHGLVAQEIGRWPPSCSPEYALGAGSWRAREWLGPARRARRGRAGGPRGLRRRSARRPRASSAGPGTSCCGDRSSLDPRTRAGGPSASLLCALGLLGGVVAPAPGADERGGGDRVHHRRHPRTRGEAVELDGTLMTTDPAQPRPAIVLAHGFGGTKADSADVARTLARDGYTVITYTARGFGRSGGLIHLDHPDFEGADAVRVVDFAASRAEVQRSGTTPSWGSPAPRTAVRWRCRRPACDSRIDAIAPMFTWNSLPQALFPQHRVAGPPTSLADVTPADTTGVFKQRWASLLFSGGGRGARAGRPDPPRIRSAAASPRRCARPTRRRWRPVPRLRVDRPPDPVQPGGRPRPYHRADAHRGRGGRHALRAGPGRCQPAGAAGGHAGPDGLGGRGPRRRDRSRAVAAGDPGWFDRYLRQDATPPGPGFSVAVPQTSLVGRAGNAIRRSSRRPAIPWTVPPALCWVTPGSP